MSAGAPTRSPDPHPCWRAAVVARGPRRAVDALDHLGEVRVRDVGDHHPQRHRPLHLQAAGDPVRKVSELADRLLDAPLGGRADHLVVQIPGDGRNRHPARGGRPPGCRQPSSPFPPRRIRDVSSGGLIPRAVHARNPPAQGRNRQRPRFSGRRPPAHDTTVSAQAPRSRPPPSWAWADGAPRRAAPRPRGTGASNDPSCVA